MIPRLQAMRQQSIEQNTHETDLIAHGKALGSPLGGHTEK